MGGKRLPSQASWCLRLHAELVPAPSLPCLQAEAHQAWVVSSPGPWSQAEIWPGPWAASPCGRSPREAGPQQGPQGTPPQSGAQARLKQPGSAS